MASQKQTVYAELLFDALINIRLVCGVDGMNPDELFRVRDNLVDASASANFLHNIPHHILQPQYEEFDLQFLNRAVPFYLRLVSNRLRPRTAHLLVALYEDAPSEIRSRLSWSPSGMVRAVAAQWSAA